MKGPDTREWTPLLRTPPLDGQVPRPRQLLDKDPGDDALQPEGWHCISSSPTSPCGAEPKRCFSACSFSSSSTVRTSDAVASWRDAVWDRFGEGGRAAPGEVTRQCAKWLALGFRTQRGCFTDLADLEAAFSELGVGGKLGPRKDAEMLWARLAHEGAMQVSALLGLLETGFSRQTTPQSQTFSALDARCAPGDLMNTPTSSGSCLEVEATEVGGSRTVAEDLPCPPDGCWSATDELDAGHVASPPSLERESFSAREEAAEVAQEIAEEVAQEIARRVLMGCTRAAQEATYVARLLLRVAQRQAEPAAAESLVLPEPPSCTLAEQVTADLPSLEPRQAAARYCGRLLVRIARRRWEVGDCVEASQQQRPRHGGHLGCLAEALERCSATSYTFEVLSRAVLAQSPTAWQQQQALIAPAAAVCGRYTEDLLCRAMRRSTDRMEGTLPRPTAPAIDAAPEAGKPQSPSSTRADLRWGLAPAAEAGLARVRQHPDLAPEARVVLEKYFGGATPAESNKDAPAPCVPIAVDAAPAIPEPVDEARQKALELLEQGKELLEQEKALQSQLESYAAVDPDGCPQQQLQPRAPPDSSRPTRPAPANRGRLRSLSSAVGGILRRFRRPRDKADSAERPPS